MQSLTPDDPQRIGPYRLLGLLGTGGMGRVYLARSEGGRTVAVKLVRPELAERDEFRNRFRQEVQAARRVGGEWTAPVLDADTETAAPWVATGYVAGPALDVVVGRDHGPLPERSVTVLAGRLAHALRAIHGAGLLHRDLKPSNILLTIDGPRVIDFGIARALDAATGEGLTSTGMVVGSPGWMSPEQVLGQHLTTAADVFCLGAVLAYAATGRLPFGDSGGGVHAVLYRIAHDEPDLSGLTGPLAELIADCLAKSSGERPSVDDVLARSEAMEAAAEPAGEPWLPAPLLAQLGRHAVSLLNAEPPAAPQAGFGPPAAFGDTAGRAATTPYSTPGPHAVAATPPYGAPPFGTPRPGDPAPTSYGLAAPVPQAFGAGQGGPPAQPAGAYGYPGPAPATAGAGRPGTEGRGGWRPPQAAGLAEAPTRPAPAPAEPAAPRPRRRMKPPVIAACAAGALVVAGGATWALVSGSGGSTRPVAVASSAPATSSAPSTSATPGRSMPAGYVGIWQGSRLRLVIKAGDVGQVVVHSYSVDADAQCEGDAKLVAAAATGVKLDARVTGGVPSASGCGGGGAQTLATASDGSLTWSAGGHSAVLRKSGPISVPQQFLGTWQRSLGSGYTQTITIRQGDFGAPVVTLVADTTVKPSPSGKATTKPKPSADASAKKTAKATPKASTKPKANPGTSDTPAAGKHCEAYADLFSADGKLVVGPSVVDTAHSAAGCAPGGASELTVSGDQLTRDFLGGDTSDARTYVRISG
ncbi:MULTISPECIES: serine/threonine-protein kinase [Streptomycetaceae]|uniref:Putative serine-threonine protein kinase n=1 Tax=Streptantibioticus cattleyicolor (strain ATCC 35852 / DSM 46488 / JCM 4925 / NBRC 14057 / NRRL 8057) TaxID=1003195 RepID=F8JVJ8_STREN|nr:MULTISPECIES: serine/threonine-protein kinase [Streptomycetaceae]AEW95697.1 putative serine-threonine protein kinase [Streptantibioticus cattleyicolor NRRL 8057 = DSM 46488]MYS60243.1 protein kinase [Streptomyces sp. SID5468]CCB76035.1 putative serine/threonine protein kinase [Streptantibioticus cattleyicolor NRRL 8057 = DSM 46488]